MADLIERSAAIEALIKTPGVGNRALDKVRQLPAVDAVPVVRCEDCKWRNHDDWSCNFWEGVRIPQAYCSHGERREGDGDGGGA